MRVIGESSSAAVDVKSDDKHHKERRFMRLEGTLEAEVMVEALSTVSFAFQVYRWDCESLSLLRSFTARSSFFSRLFV